MKPRMESPGEGAIAGGSPVEMEAAETYVDRIHGDWSAMKQSELERRLECDREFADAWRRVDESWRALEVHAESPEIMSYRAEAISTLRKSGARRWWNPPAMKSWQTRWAAAAALLGVLVAVTTWQMTIKGHRSDEFRTDIGEQRLIELADHSRISMDAATRMVVEFSKESRTVRLLDGQAQFSVAKDPARPFKVIVGARTVVAVGTVFTVEYVDRKVHVAMLEGKVAVLGAPTGAVGSAGRSQGAVSRQRLPADVAAVAGAVEKSVGSFGADVIELDAGEELRIANDGPPVVSRDADLEAATAWREGKVIFRTEPLGEAIGRMNRYSRLQIRIDNGAVAAIQVSGVFEAGDTRGFVEALERNFPVTADYAEGDAVHLRAR